MSTNTELDARQSLQYAVGRICDTYIEKEQSTNLHRKRPEPSKETLTILSDLLYKQTELIALELQHFAQHANRKVIKPEDVLLLARKQPHVQRALIKFQQEQLSKKRRRLDE